MARKSGSPLMCRPAFSVLALFAAVVATAAGSGDVLRPVDPSALDIEQVSLSGHVDGGEAAIFAALQIADGRASLITYDVRAAERRLEAIDGIARASVRRSYPSGLVVRLTRRASDASLR